AVLVVAVALKLAFSPPMKAAADITVVPRGALRFSLAWQSLRSGQSARRSQYQPEHDRYVDRVPDQAVEKCRAVGTGVVEDHACHPAAERHAEQRRHQHDAD